MNTMLHALYLGVILALLLVVRVQDQTVVKQRITIKQMVQNPYCLIP